MSYLYANTLYVPTRPNYFPFLSVSRRLSSGRIGDTVLAIRLEVPGLYLEKLSLSLLPGDFRFRFPWRLELAPLLRLGGRRISWPSRSPLHGSKFPREYFQTNRRMLPFHLLLRVEKMRPFSWLAMGTIRLSRNSLDVGSRLRPTSVPSILLRRPHLCVCLYHSLKGIPHE